MTDEELWLEHIEEYPQIKTWSEEKREGARKGFKSGLAEGRNLLIEQLKNGTIYQNFLEEISGLQNTNKKLIQKISEFEKENAELKAQIPQWHDVRKEDDYPENKREGDEFYCKLKNEALDMEWYEVLVWYIEYQTEDIYRVPVDYMFKSLKTGKNVSDYVIAWCELPQFKEQI